jgi:hypothetical protein
VLSGGYCPGGIVPYGGRVHHPPETRCSGVRRVHALPCTCQPVTPAQAEAAAYGGNQMSRRADTKVRAYHRHTQETSGIRLWVDMTRLNDALLRGAVHLTGHRIAAGPASRRNGVLKTALKQRILSNSTVK